VLKSFLMLGKHINKKNECEQLLLWSLLTVLHAILRVLSMSQNKTLLMCGLCLVA
jgi:hypothetical protein